jgi:hypothetical protein
MDRHRGIQNNSGKVIEIVPGTTDDSITVDRICLHKSKMLEALGYSVKTIQDIRDPIDIEEIEHHPDGSSNTTTYAGCWISQNSKNVAVGTVMIIESATLQVTEIR